MGYGQRIQREIFDDLAPYAEGRSPVALSQGLALSTAVLASVFRLQRPRKILSVGGMKGKA